MQGVGVGGEWGGSVLLSMEWGRHGRRGFNASWPQFGVPAGLLLANVTVLVFSLISGPDFVTWGWRIPFLLSIVLVGVGLWIRLGILETPMFQQLVAQQRVERQPVVQVIKRHPKEIILASLARLSEQAPFYIFTAFIFVYAVGAAPALGFDRNFILLPVMVAAMLGFIMIPLFGHLSDIYGRRPIYILGAALTGLFGFAYFGMLGTGIPVVVFIAIAISLIPHDMQYGPQAAMIAESFRASCAIAAHPSATSWHRCSPGGPAPLIAVALFAAFRTGTAVAFYILACAIVSIIAVALMKERAGVDISDEYGESEAVVFPVTQARTVPRQRVGLNSEVR